MSGLLSQLVKEQNYYNSLIIISKNNINNLNNRKMSECHDNMNHNSRIAQTIEQINQDLKKQEHLYTIAKDYVDDKIFIDKIKQKFDNLEVKIKIIEILLIVVIIVIIFMLF
jgi:hypothetical protein